MKNADIVTMENVLLALDQYLPSNMRSLLDEYAEVYEKIAAKNTREKQAYLDKAQYYRGYVRKWREENPDKVKQYHDTYGKRKKEIKVFDNEKTESLITKVREKQKMIQAQESAKEAPKKKTRKKQR